MVWAFRPSFVQRKLEKWKQGMQLTEFLSYEMINMRM